MIYKEQIGVPEFVCKEFKERTQDYAVLIPIINEGNRIRKELQRAKKI